MGSPCARATAPRRASRGTGSTRPSEPRRPARDRARPRRSRRRRRARSTPPRRGLAGCGDARTTACGAEVSTATCPPARFEGTARNSLAGMVRAEDDAWAGETSTQEARADPARATPVMIRARKGFMGTSANRACADVMQQTRGCSADALMQLSVTSEAEAPVAFTAPGSLSKRCHDRQPSARPTSIIVTESISRTSSANPICWRITFTRSEGVRRARPPRGGGPDALRPGRGWAAG